MMPMRRKMTPARHGRDFIVPVAPGCCHGSPGGRFMPLVLVSMPPMSALIKDVGRIGRYRHAYGLASILAL